MNKPNHQLRELLRSKTYSAGATPQQLACRRRRRRAPAALPAPTERTHEVTDPVATPIKREITRLRNVAKTRPMSLSQKLVVLEKVKAKETELRQHRLNKA